jgi:hypothetical protein
MVHRITSLLVAKPDFPWPERTALIHHALDTYAAALPAGSAPSRGPAPPPASA